MTTTTHFEGDSSTQSAHSSSFGTTPCKEAPGSRFEEIQLGFEGCPEPNGPFEVKISWEAFSFEEMWGLSNRPPQNVLKHIVK